MGVNIAPFLIAFFLVVAEQPHGVSMEDFFRKECEAGKQEACARVEHLSSDLIMQKRLENRSVEFWKDVNTQELMLEKKKPNLEAAYPLVLHDYFTMEAEAGDKQTLLEDRLPQCARHYHNHWINKKMWWPANDDGSPNWPSIYTFIVDHYYGFCLKQP